MMRQTLLLCLTAFLVGCHGQDDIVRQTNMDSPVVVSDNSTHSRRAGGKFARPTIGVDKFTATFGKPVKYLECLAGFSCSPIPLNPGWSLELDDSGGSAVGTISDGGGGGTLVNLDFTTNPSCTVSFNGSDHIKKGDDNYCILGGAKLSNGTATSLPCASRPCRLQVSEN